MNREELEVIAVTKVTDVLKKAKVIKHFQRKNGDDWYRGQWMTGEGEHYSDEVVTITFLAGITVWKYKGCGYELCFSDYSADVPLEIERAFDLLDHIDPEYI